MVKRIDSLMFTPGAQRALGLAHETALSLRQPYVSPEYILLGLLQEYKGLAAQILIERGLDLHMICEYILRGIQQRRAQLTDESLQSTPGYTQQAKQVFVQAAQRAYKLGHATIGTEHLFLGVLAVDDGIGASILEQQGVNSDAIYQNVLLALDHERPPVWRRYILPLSLTAGALMFASTGCAVTMLLVRQHVRRKIA
jgi:ATPases with chaperone activity, ATP-binding subunit